MWFWGGGGGGAPAGALKEATNPHASNKQDFYTEAHLQALFDALQAFGSIDDRTRDAAVEILRQIAELLVWGERHKNEAFFDIFCEQNILSYFVEVVAQPRVASAVKVQVLQTLSILVQNTHRKTAIYYLFSNNYINTLLSTAYDFSNEEVVAWYVSFIKSLSLLVTEETVKLFLNRRAPSFPVFSEAVKFFIHRDSMVRTHVRTVTLSIFKIREPIVEEFIVKHSAVFSHIACYLRAQWADRCRALRACRRRVSPSPSLYLARPHASRGLQGSSPSSSQYAAPAASPPPGSPAWTGPSLASSLASLRSGFAECEEFLDYIQDIFGIGVEVYNAILVERLLLYTYLPVFVGCLCRQASPVAQVGRFAFPDNHAPPARLATSSFAGRGDALRFAPSVSLPSLPRRVVSEETVTDSSSSLARHHSDGIVRCSLGSFSSFGPPPSFREGTQSVESQSPGLTPRRHHSLSSPTVYSRLRVKRRSQQTPQAPPSSSSSRSPSSPSRRRERAEASRSVSSSSPASSRHSESSDDAQAASRRSSEKENEGFLGGRCLARDISSLTGKASWARWKSPWSRKGRSGKASGGRDKAEDDKRETAGEDDRREPEGEDAEGDDKEESAERPLAPRECRRKGDGKRVDDGERKVRPMDTRREGGAEDVEHASDKAKASEEESARHHDGDEEWKIASSRTQRQRDDSHASSSPRREERPRRASCGDRSSSDSASAPPEGARESDRPRKNATRRSDAEDAKRESDAEKTRRPRGRRDGGKTKRRSESREREKARRRQEREQRLSRKHSQGRSSSQSSSLPFNVAAAASSPGLTSKQPQSSTGASGDEDVTHQLVALWLLIQTFTTIENPNLLRPVLALLLLPRVPQSLLLLASAPSPATPAAYVALESPAQCAGKVETFLPENEAGVAEARQRAQDGAADGAAPHRGVGEEQQGGGLSTDTQGGEAMHAPEGVEGGEKAAFHSLEAEKSRGRQDEEDAQNGDGQRGTPLRSQSSLEPVVGGKGDAGDIEQGPQQEGGGAAPHSGQRQSAAEATERIEARTGETLEGETGEGDLQADVTQAASSSPRMASLEGETRRLDFASPEGPLAFPEVASPAPLAPPDAASTNSPRPDLQTRLCESPGAPRAGRPFFMRTAYGRDAEASGPLASKFGELGARQTSPPTSAADAAVRVSSGGSSRPGSSFFHEKLRALRSMATAGGASSRGRQAPPWVGTSGSERGDTSSSPSSLEGADADPPRVRGAPLLSLLVVFQRRGERGRERVAGCWRGGGHARSKRVDRGPRARPAGETAEGDGGREAPCARQKASAEAALTVWASPRQADADEGAEASAEGTVPMPGRETRAARGGRRRLRARSEATKARRVSVEGCGEAPDACRPDVQWTAPGSASACSRYSGDEADAEGVGSEDEDASVWVENPYREALERLVSAEFVGKMRRDTSVLLGGALLHVVLCHPSVTAVFLQNAGVLPSLRFRSVRRRNRAAPAEFARGASFSLSPCPSYVSSSLSLTPSPPSPPSLADAASSSFVFSSPFVTLHGHISSSASFVSLPTRLDAEPDEAGRDTNEALEGLPFQSRRRMEAESAAKGEETSGNDADGEAKETPQDGAGDSQAVAESGEQRQGEEVGMPQGAAQEAAQSESGEACENETGRARTAALEVGEKGDEEVAQPRAGLEEAEQRAAQNGDEQADSANVPGTASLGEDSDTNFRVSCRWTLLSNILDVVTEHASEEFLRPVTVALMSRLVGLVLLSTLARLRRSAIVPPFLARSSPSAFCPCPSAASPSSAAAREGEPASTPPARGLPGGAKRRSGKTRGRRQARLLLQLLQESLARVARAAQHLKKATASAVQAALIHADAQAQAASKGVGSMNAPVDLFWEEWESLKNAPALDLSALSRDLRLLLPPSLAGVQQSNVASSRKGGAADGFIWREAATPHEAQRRAVHEWLIVRQLCKDVAAVASLYQSPAPASVSVASPSSGWPSPLLLERLSAEGCTVLLRAAGGEDDGFYRRLRAAESECEDQEEESEESDSEDGRDDEPRRGDSENGDGSQGGGGGRGGLGGGVSRSAPQAKTSSDNAGATREGGATRREQKAPEGRHAHAAEGEADRGRGRTRLSDRHHEVGSPHSAGEKGAETGAAGDSRGRLGPESRGGETDLAPGTEESERSSPSGSSPPQARNADPREPAVAESYAFLLKKEEDTKGGQLASSNAEGAPVGIEQTEGSVSVWLADRNFIRCFVDTAGGLATRYFLQSETHALLVSPSHTTPGSADVRTACPLGSIDCRVDPTNSRCLHLLLFASAPPPGDAVWTSTPQRSLDLEEDATRLAASSALASPCAAHRPSRRHTLKALTLQVAPALGSCAARRGSGPDALSLALSPASWAPRACTGRSRDAVGATAAPAAPASSWLSASLPPGASAPACGWYCGRGGGEREGAQSCARPTHWVLRIAFDDTLRCCIVAKSIQEGRHRARTAFRRFIDRFLEDANADDSLLFTSPFAFPPPAWNSFAASFSSPEIVCPKGAAL
ncbi:hypothetical protein BESB_074560 [Besnoitia besnoiti]|uniref:FPL domain-containing protein n=1 Tax=Besnoitia besnoiti TaxID=94643 RepID=A0A2A9MAS0_BESBE|nr:uncharacterized protein BESB_074560 [Besnoitia besnoiti]PFH34304.1 hypothetical protein BESB_074560 [Besnoitia besnoiti]